MKPSELKISHSVKNCQTKRTVKNCQKLPKFLWFWKTNNFQAIKDTCISNFDSKMLGLGQHCVKISRPYLRYFSRYKQLKRVRVGSCRFISSSICDRRMSFPRRHLERFASIGMIALIIYFSVFKPNRTPISVTTNIKL